MKVKLSRNFTLLELVKSPTANINKIVNEPTNEAIVALSCLVTATLQPLRDELKEPILITSGYRCEALNKAVKGSYRSQHLTGEAADIMVKGDGMRIITTLLHAGIPFDQCIFYTKKNVVHLSYSRFNDNRYKLLYQ